MTIALLQQALDAARAPHASPSRIVARDACERRWGYNKLSPEPFGKLADDGVKTHKILEAWLRDGTPPDPESPQGRTALSGLHLLPPPGQAIVEHAAVYETAAGLPPGAAPIRYVQYIDMMHTYVPGDSVTIGDHKTIGDWRRMKSPDQLAEDVQRISYAHYAVETLGVAVVWAQWVYYNRNRTDEPARAVWLCEDAATIRAKFEPINRRAAALVEATHAKHRLPVAQWIETLARGLDHCDAFGGGGCPYKSHCHVGLTPIELATAAARRQEQRAAFRRPK